MDFELSEEQRNLRDHVAEFARAEVAPIAERLDAEAKFPTALYRKVGDLGVTAIPFTKESGGLGLGTLDMTMVIEQLARADQSLAVTTMVSVSAGLILERFGTPEQKEKYLPDIISGNGLGALAGTEPDAGSDTAGFKTRAVQQDGRWILDGQKAFITNAGTDISTCALTLAVTSPPTAERKEYSLFVVARGTPGYSQGEPYRKLGWHSSDTRPLFFDQCAVGPEALMGAQGQGRYLLHKGYQQARVFLAACSLGLADAALEHSVAYARERQAFGASIGRLQLIQEMIAQMAIKVDCARLLTYRAAWLADRGESSLKELAMAKYYATEIGTEVANMAIQVHGGWGFMDDCPVSRYYRDNRICTIGDGSSQIQLLLIARSLGLDVKFGD